MKKLLLFFLISINLMIVYANSGTAEEAIKPGEIIVNEENYSMREILILPWGSGENEVGLGQEGEYKWGPQAIFVDGKENIYISDTANQRILEFSINGNFIKRINTFSGCSDLYVDNNENIYVNKGGANLYVYNKEGQIINKIHYPKDKSGSVQKIIVTDERYINLITEYSTSSKHNGMFHKIKVSDNKDKYGFAESTIVGTYEGTPSFYSDKIIDLNERNKNSSEFNEKGILLQGDETNNSYLVDSLTIQKYSEKGNLLMKIKIFPDQYIGSSSLLNLFISKRGDIYQLYTTKDGIVIVKWGK